MYAIEDSFLEDTEYFHEKNEKTNLVIHHTAGGGNPYSVIQWWNQQKPDMVATNFVMGGRDQYDGLILRTMPEQAWAWNLGIGNARIERKTLSIELCSWGNLVERNGKFYNWANTEVPVAHIIDLHDSEYGKDFRGCRFFEKYTDTQIENLELWLQQMCHDHPIDLSLFKEGFDWWWFELNSNALNGVDGIWNHTNYLPGKTDLYPDKRVLDILNRLVGK